MGDEDDGLLHAPLDADELVLQAVTRQPVDGAEGLVHEQDRRVGSQGPGDPHALALAARELGRVAAAVEVRVEAHQGQQVACPLSSAARIPAQQAGDGGDVLGDRDVGEEAHLLDHVADAKPELDRVHAGDVLAVEQDPARGRLLQPVDHLQAGGLAAARGAHQHADLAIGDLEVEVVHGDLAARIFLADLFEPDHGLAHPSCRQ